jgi:hypothetical protein
MRSLVGYVNTFGLWKRTGNYQLFENALTMKSVNLLVNVAFPNYRLIVFISSNYMFHAVIIWVAHCRCFLILKYF